MPTGAGHYGQFTLPEVAPTRLEPLAVASIATFPLGPVGVGLGIAALRRIRHNHRRSWTLAGTGIVLSFLVTAAAVLIVTALALNGTFARIMEQPQAGDVAASRPVASAHVAVGNCIRTLPVGETVGEVLLVPCEQEHQAQAVAVVELPGGDGDPTSSLTEAVTACATNLAAVEGETSLQPWYFVPSEKGWSQGERSAICLVRTAGMSLTSDYVNG